MLMIALLMSSCVVSKEGLEQMFRNAYLKQTGTDQYRLEGEVNLKNNQGAIHDLKYDMKIDKNGTDDQDDDLLYMVFDSDMEEDPDFEAWIEAEGFGYFKYADGNEKHYAKKHIGNIDIADELLDMVEDIALSNDGDLRTLTLKVKEESQRDIIDVLRKQMLFDAVLIDIAGSEGIKEIEINELNVTLDKDDNVVEMGFKGNHMNDVYTIDSQYSVHDDDVEIPDYRKSEFTMMNDYSGYLSEYQTFNGDRFVIMAMKYGTITFEMTEEEKYHIEYDPSVGAIRVSEVDDRNNILADYAPVSGFRELFGDFVKEFEEGSDDIQILEQKVITLQDDNADDHEGVRYFAISKSTGDYVMLDIFDDIELGILYAPYCSEEKFKEVIKQTNTVYTYGY